MGAKPLDGTRGRPSFGKEDRRKRRWPWWVGSILTLLAGAYFFFQYQVVDTQLRPLIERELTKAVHSPVSIQSVRAGLTGNVLLNQVTLAVPGSPWKSQVTVGQISVNVELFNLLFHRKPIEGCLDSLSFIKPQIILAKNMAAAPVPTPVPTSSPMTTVAPTPSSAAPATIEITPPSVPGGAATLTVASAGVTAPIPLFTIPKVSIRQGSFSVQADKTPHEVLTALDFDASTQNGNSWGINLSAHSPEVGSQGVIRFDGSFQLETLKVRGMVRLQQWPLASVGSTLKEATGWELFNGTIDMESPLVYQPGRDPWYDITADVSQATLKSPDPVGIVFSQISGRAFIRPTGINVPQEITFQVGETPFQASGLIPFNGNLSVRASSDQMYLSTIFKDVLKLREVKTEGTGTADLFVAGTLASPVIAGTAKLGPSSVGSWPLESLSVKTKYEDRVLKLESVDGKLFGGSFKANGFVGITGQPDAPVSLKADLTDVDAKKVAKVLGWSETSGQIDQELYYGGTLDKPVFSSKGTMELTRTLRDTPFHYSIVNNVQLKQQRLQVSATINDKSRLEGLFVEGPDFWTLQKFTAVTGKKTLALTGKGTWPKTQDQPIQLEISGKQIPLEQLPIFNDQFPDITGAVNLDAKMGGTRKDPTASVRLSSGQVFLKGQPPQPLDALLSWKPGELDFEKLTLGDVFAAYGSLGLAPDLPLDLKIIAKKMSIPFIAEVGGWNNPPEPLEGLVTGHIHFSGLIKNPIVEGDDIAIDSLKVGDWYADKVTASLGMEQGKLAVKKLDLKQPSGSLSVTGSWDTRLQPGVMALNFSTQDFQLGKGPYLTGDFLWQAKTGEPFWRNWNGDFTSASFSLKDLKNNVHKFNDFSMTATCEEMVVKGNLKLGKTITGSAVLDLSEPTPTLQALLRIEPVLLAEAPEINQYIPPSLKVTGKISGEIKLKKGTFQELPMEGSLMVTDGSIQDYDFDRMALAFSGNRSKISSDFTLNRDQATFSLSGSLESPGAFWDSDSRINVNGPIARVKLQNILTLVKINTEKHGVGGEVNGNLSVTGPLSAPVAEFTVKGEDLRYDNNIVPSAELRFSYSNGKITLEKNKINLPRGEIDIDQGSAYLDPQDPSVAVLDLAGSTQNLPIALFNFTSQIHMAGRLALDEKEGRPTFDGLLSVLETNGDNKTPKPFDVALSVHKKVIEFKPLDNSNPQLVGKVDLSQDQKVIFNDFRLVNAAGAFSVDGNLDFNGPCSLVSDSKNVPIQEIGKWFLPNFPLNGTGSYHLIFNGTLDDPLFTISISVLNGQVGDLKFDVLDGELKANNNTLFLGDEENPITLSRENAFTFSVGGKMPIALTHAGWLKVHNQQMDITANMDKGDFGLILLAGWAKKASGDMDFSAHLGGTLDNPDLTMDLDLNKCQLVPPMVAQSIDDLSGRIKVRHNRLVVQNLNGRIGQGRVFINSKSQTAEESDMVLVNFIPQYLDFLVTTEGDHGLWLSIPTIMRKGEWGEIYFYGNTPADPMVIKGPLTQPVVSGTAFLDTGHYTFPPVEALDEHGQKIEYRELAGVTFDLKLVSGKNTWYSNDFNTCYLELKVDPNNTIKIEGKDSDRTPEEAGIKCYGTASSSQGFLLYLGHRFDMQNGWIAISKGHSPQIWGKATSKLTNVDVVSAGGVRKMDVDTWVDFKGTFGSIDFKLDSSPKLDPTDPDKHQKMLLSYIMFGRDMTGYTSQQLQDYYQQNFGQTATDTVFNALNTMALSEATRAIRSYVQQGLGADVQISGNPIPTGAGPGEAPVSGAGGVEAPGNTLAASSVPVVNVELTKPLNDKFSVRTDFGLNRGVTGDLSPTGSVGLDYNITQKLKFSFSGGSNDEGRDEVKGGLEFSSPLPDVIAPKKGDLTKPNFERFDVFPVGPGKFSIIWVTDKVTKCEIRVLDASGQLVKVVAENKQFDYRHEMTVDGLDPTKDLQIQISAKDPNGNERIATQKVSASIQ